MKNRALFVPLFLVPVLVLLPSHPAVAQTASPLLLPPPPQQGAWEISFKRERPRKPLGQNSGTLVEPAQVSAEIQSRDYTVHGDLGKCVTHYSDGKSVLLYTMGLVGVEENPQDPNDLVIDDMSSPGMVQTEFRKHYPGLEWVRPDLYKGVVEFHGTPCHYFAEADTTPTPSPTASETVVLVDPLANPACGRQAWFGMDGRPLAYKEREMTATFTHKPPAAVPPIEVPERFQAVAKRYLDSLRPSIQH